MTEVFKFTDESIQDYIDGRLSSRNRMLFAQHLLANPGDAAKVSELQLQNDLLKGVGIDILDEEVPGHLRAVLQKSGVGKPSSGGRMNKSPVGSTRKSGFAIQWLVAASLATLVMGGFAGWVGRDYIDPPASSEDVILSSGLDAYRLYAGDKEYPVEFGSDKIDAVTSWLDRTFKTPFKVPTLEDEGYKLVGGRVLPYSSGNYGFFLYENAKSERVAVICWPRGQSPQPVRRYNPGKDYTTRYWNKSKFGFAVYAQSANSEFETVADKVTSFYETLFGEKK